MASVYAIKERIKQDLEFFVWQSRFIKTVIAELENHIKTCKEEPSHATNLQSYLTDIKGKFEKANKALLEINEHTKKIEEQIKYLESYNIEYQDDTKNTKEYVETLQKIQRHLHKDIEPNNAQESTALRSLLEALRIAEQSQDAPTLIFSSEKICKLLKQIQLWLERYVLRAYTFLLRKHFKDLDTVILKLFEKKNESLETLKNMREDALGTYHFIKNKIPQFPELEQLERLRSILVMSFQQHFAAVVDGKNNLWIRLINTAYLLEVKAILLSIELKNSGKIGHDKIVQDLGHSLGQTTNMLISQFVESGGDVSRLDKSIVRLVELAAKGYEKHGRFETAFRIYSDISLNHKKLEGTNYRRERFPNLTKTVFNEQDELRKNEEDRNEFLQIAEEIKKSPIMQINAEQEVIALTTELIKILDEKINELTHFLETEQ
ncbi:MAG: hypothetical protein ACMXYF_03460 [Candidatus Woesearchaeota archaeon]